MDQWYVVKAKPQQEKRASMNLRNQNFKVILPLLQKTSNGSKINYEPLFPSYIFVSFDITKNYWPKINNSYGVSKLLSFNGIPKELNVNFISYLEEIIDKNGFVKANIFQFKKNQCVQINNGPFKGFFASVIKKVGEQRVKLMIDFLKENHSHY